MTLGEKIRHLRNLKGYSQENLASMLGISYTSFSKIERGETDPSFSRIEQIAEVFGLKTHELIGFGEGGSVYIQNNQGQGVILGGTNTNNVNPNLKEEIIDLKFRLTALEEKISQLLNTK